MGCMLCFEHFTVIKHRLLALEWSLFLEGIINDHTQRPNIIFTCILESQIVRFWCFGVVCIGVQAILMSIVILWTNSIIP